jgi:hypothetical protein
VVAESSFDDEETEDGDDEGIHLYIYTITMIARYIVHEYCAMDCIQRCRL